MAKSEAKNSFAVESDGTLRFENGVACGQVLQDVDGYYYWWPGERNGSWPAHALRDIANLLDEMNKDWDAEVSQMMTSQSA